MKLKFLLHIPSNFPSRLISNQLTIDYKKQKIPLVQNQHLDNFINNYQITSVLTINSQTWNTKFLSVGLDDIKELPNLLIYTVDQRIELCDLIKLIISLYDYTNQYLYIALNKFKVYSNTDNNIPGQDYDQQLIDYCTENISKKFIRLQYYFNSDDDGSIGNYIHPVTQLFLKKC
jgi:hypothetical protein